MAVYEIIPIREVRKIDVRDTLNANGGVVDDVHSSMYRSAANIDKWSKKKPTKYYKLIFAKGDEEPKQWQADNGLCGFAEDSVVFSSTDALVDAHSNGDIYIYEPPIGGDYPYRLRDFSGYSAKAKSPIWSGLHPKCSNCPSIRRTATQYPISGVALVSFITQTMWIRPTWKVKASKSCAIRNTPERFTSTTPSVTPS